MRSATRLALLLLTVVMTAGACGQPGRYAKYESFVSDEGGYRIRYLDPPWDLVEGEGAEVLFRIASNAARFAGVDAAVLPKYELRITVVSGNAMSLAARDERRAGSRGEEVLVPLREVETRTGDRGWELVTQFDAAMPRYRRYVYVEHPRGALRLLFEGTPDLDEREVDEMVESVEVLE